MAKISWEQAIVKELEQAKTARDSGKEGMARVCSRRAAGIAIGEYLAKNDLTDPDPSAIGRLKCLHAVPSVPTNAKRAAHLLTLRVDVNHELLIEADLIREAQKLIISLFPEFQFPKD